VTVESSAVVGVFWARRIDDFSKVKAEMVTIRKVRDMYRSIISAFPYEKNCRYVSYYSEMSLLHNTSDSLSQLSHIKQWLIMYLSSG
jgi:hypothetical protein